MEDYLSPKDAVIMVEWFLHIFIGKKMDETFREM